MRLAATVGAFTMVVAILAFTLAILFMSNNGYEFALALFAVTLVLTFQGAGRLSLHNRVAEKIESD